MKLQYVLVSAFALLLSAPAMADIFAFKNIDGFEKCLRQDHLVETSKAGDKKQTKFLDKMDVQYRCFESATAHLSKEKKPDVVTEWVKVGMKNSNRANVIDLMKILATLDPKKCNDAMIYDTILDIFSGPKSDDKKSLYQRAKATTKVCLKDPTFKADFMDEQESTPGSYRFNAVCDVLMTEGLIKACKKG